MQMMFSRTNRRTNPTFNQNVQQRQQIQIQQQPPANIFMLPMRIMPKSEPEKIEEEPIRYRRPAVISNYEPPKMTWGKPTWYFLHCMAHKIKPEYFDSMKEEILSKIYAICTSLPCPYCANHAKEYLNRINFKAITMKSELVNLLYMFHNSVNKRKEYKLLSRNDLEQIYQPMDIISVFNEFMNHFDKKNTSKLLHDSLFRTRQSQNIKIWFQSKLHCFE